MLELTEWKQIQALDEAFLSKSANQNRPGLHNGVVVDQVAHFKDIGERKSAWFKKRTETFMSLVGPLEGWPSNECGMIEHHLAFNLGPACSSCGKPLRSPAATYCVECGEPRRE